VLEKASKDNGAGNEDTSPDKPDEQPTPPPPAPPDLSPEEEDTLVTKEMKDQLKSLKGDYAWFTQSVHGDLKRDLKSLWRLWEAVFSGVEVLTEEGRGVTGGIPGAGAGGGGGGKEMRERWRGVDLWVGQRY
jgi:hypothetical protein